MSETVSTSISYDRASGRYVAMADGKVVTRTKSLDRAKHLLNMHLTGLCEMAREEEESGIQFSVSERFQFVEAITRMVADYSSPSAIVTGEGGIGKTYTILKTLNDVGFVNCMDIPEGESVPTRKTYALIKGFASPMALYRALYENSERVIIFDDCDEVLENDTATNILKAALDSYSRRLVCWQTEMKGNELPNSFIFNGGVIFISNRTLSTLNQAVRTRALCVDLSMTALQKVERMEHIIHSGEYMEDVDIVYKTDALEFIRQHLSVVRNLSLRTLAQIVKIRATNRSDWKRVALYVLVQ